jgi:hypothetical protein
LYRLKNSSPERTTSSLSDEQLFCQDHIQWISAGWRPCDSGHALGWPKIMGATTSYCSGKLSSRLVDGRLNQGRDSPIQQVPNPRRVLAEDSWRWAQGSQRPLAVLSFRVEPEHQNTPALRAGSSSCRSFPYRDSRCSSALQVPTRKRVKELG